MGQNLIWTHNSYGSGTSINTQPSESWQSGLEVGGDQLVSHIEGLDPRTSLKDPRGRIGTVEDDCLNDIHRGIGIFLVELFQRDGDLIQFRCFW